jgi:hypothetical protein
LLNALPLNTFTLNQAPIMGLDMPIFGLDGGISEQPTPTGDAPSPSLPSQPDPSHWDNKSNWDAAAAQIANSRRRLSAAALSTIGSNTVITPPQDRSVSHAPIPPIERQLSEHTAEIRDTARVLAAEFSAQIEELKRNKPNEPGPLAGHDALVLFFEKMATGLRNLANALDQTIVADAKHEPVFLGKAAECARWLQRTVAEWLDENRTTVVEVPFRIGLFGMGLAFVHALGVDSSLVTTLVAGLALKRAPRKHSKKSPPSRGGSRT